MLKITKIAGIVLILLLVSPLFFGCNEYKRITLRVLYYPDDADADFWFGEFERQNPGVKIDRENLFEEAFHDKLKFYASEGNLPDVMYVRPSGRSDYLHDQRLLKDLAPFVKRDGLENLYIPFALEPSLQQAGYLAIIPQSIITTGAFYINTEVLNSVGLQPAKTYDDLKAQVPMLRAAGYETVMIGAGNEWVMQRCLYSMVIGRFCGEGWEERILGGQAKFTDADFTASFDFIRLLFADGVISRFALDVDYDDAPLMFANNQGAYYIDGGWRAGAFITDSGTGKALISPARQNRMRVGVFPDIPGTRVSSSSSVIPGAGYAIAAAVPAGSEKERLAWELVKWMTGKEVSARMTETGITPTPSRADLDFDAMALEPMQKAVANLGNEFLTATAVIESVLPPEVYVPINTVLTELAKGTMTALQAAAAVQSAFDSWKN